MKIKLSIGFIFLLFITGAAQKEKVLSFVHDTMSWTGKDKMLEGDYLEVKLKDLSEVRLMKTNDNRIFLRFIVTRNFYFDKVGVLEILSGSKTYPAKEVKQHKITKTRGLYITEIYSNYLATLRNEGVSGLIFNQAVTKFTRNDRKQVKKMATMFYNSYTEGVKKRN